VSRLNKQDLQILEDYADRGNRELYWNYLASRPGSDGYGLLALGVVRNDNVPGAVANAFADSAARGAGVRLTERGWNEFGVDLMKRDLEARQEHMRGGHPDLALNLPAKDVMEVHDRAFRNAGIPVNAWTPRDYLQAAREQGAQDAGPNATPAQRETAANAEMERGWSMMLDNRNWGLDRGAATLDNIARRYRDELPDPLGYTGRLTEARTLAAVSRPNDDPDRIGASSIYHQRRADGRWLLVDETVSMSMAPRIPREERDPARLRELEDTRRLRLEIRDKRDDFHPQDPARTEGIRRSPWTLADAEREPSVAPTRLAAAMDQPGSPDHTLYLGGRSAVERMEAGLDRGYDANSEKLAQAATVLARQHGLERIDHVVLSIDNGRGVRAGENLFVIQGRPEDPAHSRAVMKTDEALARTADQNEQSLAEAREQASIRTAAQEQERAQAASREHVARTVT
jgi:hypothetical protein